MITHPMAKALRSSCCKAAPSEDGFDNGLDTTSDLVGVGGYRDMVMVWVIGGDDDDNHHADGGIGDDADDVGDDVDDDYGRCGMLRVGLDQNTPKLDKAKTRVL